MNNLGLLILRVSFSALMITHGIPKFLKLVNGDFSFGDPLGIGSFPTFIFYVFAELIAPVFMIIGFKTKWFAVPTIIATGITAFIIQANGSIHSKELTLLYLFGFISIAFLGAGSYSMDKS